MSKKTTTPTTETAATVKKTTMLQVPFELLDLHVNPREDLGDIKGLAANIMENGLKLPVRGYRQNGYYYIIDGKRRFSALQIISGLDAAHEVLKGVPFMEIPKDTTEADILIDQLVSNEGEPLKPIELAEAIKSLAGQGLKPVEIAQKLAKTKVYVQELLRVAELPDNIKKLIAKGKISVTLIRQQMKAGTLDEFIAKVNEGGLDAITDVEFDDVDTSDAGGAKPTSKKKITKKDVDNEKPNSMRELKRFAAHFSEIFPDEHKQATYEFCTQLLRNELTYEQILNYFTDGKEDTTGEGNQGQTDVVDAPPQKVKKAAAKKAEPKAKKAKAEKSTEPKGKKGTSRKILFDKNTNEATQSGENEQ